MLEICNFRQLTTHLSSLPQRRSVAVVWATDAETQNAVLQAVAEGFAKAVFVGAEAEVRRNPLFAAQAQWCTCLPAETPQEAARTGVALARAGQADVLMKGLLNTDVLLRAVLDKACGLLPAGRVLTHVACAELPAYDRLLLFSDAVVIPYPTAPQRRAQAEACLAMARSLGVEEPRVALIHCSEKSDERHFPHTAEYAGLIAEARRGELGRCVIDGPLDVKTSLNAEALHHKGIDSPVGGRADALIFPDIEAANVFYKTLTLFAGARMAGLLQGTQVPVVLTSRADTQATKYFSLALGLLQP